MSLPERGRVRELSRRVGRLTLLRRLASQLSSSDPNSLHLSTIRTTNQDQLRPPPLQTPKRSLVVQPELVSDGKSSCSRDLGEGSKEDVASLDEDLLLDDWVDDRSVERREDLSVSGTGERRRVEEKRKGVSFGSSVTPL